MTRGPTIEVLSPLLGGFYFGGLLSGVNASARAHGGAVLAVQTLDAGVDYTDYSGAPKPDERLGWANADGYVIIIDAVGAGDLTALLERGKPVVIISDPSGASGCPTVAPDNRGGVRDAVDHLVEHGHTRIAFVGCLAQADMQERYAAYQEALVAHGLLVDPALVFEAVDNIELGGRLAGEAMLAAGSPSTAVFVATDSNAVGLINAFTAAGRELPRDQAIIGFDDMEAAQYTSPRLSTVRQDFADIGKAAADLVFRGLAGEPVEAVLHRVPTHLVVRESCGCGRVAAQSASDSERLGRDGARAQLAQRVAKAVGGDETPTVTASAAFVRALAVITAEIDSHDDAAERFAPAEIYAALDALFQLNPNANTADDVVAAVASYARAIGSQGSTPNAWSESAAQSLMHAMQRIQLHDKYEETAYFRKAFDTQYAVSLALLAERINDATHLQWLGHTPMSAGMLGLWTDGTDALETVGVYGELGELVGGALVGGSRIGQRTPTEEFPPRELIDVTHAHEDQVLFAVPVRSGDHDWGRLCIVGPIQTKLYTGRESTNQWAALLAVALETGVDRRRVAELGGELAVILENAPDAVARYDADLRYRYLNQAAAAQLGVPEDQIIGRTDGELGRPAELAQLWIGALQRVVSSAAAAELEYSETTDGELRWHQARIVPLFDDEGGLIGVLSSSRDISDLKRAEQTLAYQAVHDALTGLATRVLLIDRLSSAIARLERMPGALAVLFIDLDHFKEINDSLGHEIGDRVLVQVADRIKAVSRRTDTVARFGGDEFVLLSDRLGEDYDVRIIGERLVRSLAEPFTEGTHELRVSASVGIVVVSDPYVDVSTVIRNADEAMYTAKSRGRDRFHIFDPDLRERASAQQSLEADLRHALERNELRLAYQPLFSLKDGAVIGVEALLRWHHPTRGVVQPDDFIGLAEQRGLMIGIGEWVLDEALRQLSDWSLHRGLGDLTMAVNISGRQLTDPAIVTVVKDALVRHGIAPERITLEITETTLIEDGATIHDTLSAISDLGVRLALDDFGTGYSSLAHLRDFPVNTLKIDRSFVEQLGTGHRAHEIIGALTAMAHFLDMTVVGEGIEQQVQWDELRELGCDDGQGFLVARPLGPGDVVRFLDGGTPQR